MKTMIETSSTSTASGSATVTGSTPPTSVPAAVREVPMPAVPEAELKNLLQEASAMLKEIGNQAAEDDVFVVHAG